MAKIGWNYGRPQLRIGWTKDQAKLVAQNKLREYAANDGNGGAHIIVIWDYMVELAGADGQPTRVVINVRGLPVSLPQLPPLGGTVPVLVNKSRTKAAFDMDDPSISLGAQVKLGKQRHEATAAERKAKFDAKRSARD